MGFFSTLAGGFLGSSGSGGANIGHNTAYIKAFWIKVRRAPKGTPFDSTIVVDGMRLANPAAIIYECLTNGEWGMGAPDSLLDQASFDAAATTLAAEGFGLAMLWHKQESIEDFVGIVLNHIEASLALDPFTGLFRLKLIRDDYDVNTLPVFDPSNAIFEDFERRAWGESINEVTVSWTSPDTEQAETVTVHNTANLALQGGAIVSETRDYFGVRTAALALRLAARDLQAGSSALASASLRINRAGWRLLPGDVIAVNWPEYGIELLPMRIGEVDYGRPGDSEITLSLVEDVFGIPTQVYAVSDDSAWVAPTTTPAPLDYEHMTSAPYFPVAQLDGDATAQAVPSDGDLDMTFGTRVAQGTLSYDVVTQEASADGTLSWVTQTNTNLAGRAVLGSPLVAEVSTTITDLAEVVEGQYASPGVLLWFGPIDATGELALIRTADANGITVDRGVLDTVPQAWPAGTTVWMLHGTNLGSTRGKHTIGDSVTARFLPWTNEGRLSPADAADVTATMTGRLHRPYRPAAFAVDGVLFPSTPPQEPVTLTWAGRNRLTETEDVIAWNGAAVPPEAGTTYTLEMDALDGSGTLLQANYHVETGLTTESFAFDSTTYPPPSGTAAVVFRLFAVRDGLTSWQPATQQAALFQPAYNLNAIFIPD